MRRTWRRLVGVVVAGGLVAGSSVAAQAQPATAKPGEAARVVTAPLEQESFSYRPEGRRDPFLPLVRRGSDPRSGKRPEGLAGLAVADIALKGVLLSRGTYLGLVQGPDTRTYIVHANDRLLDGVVKAITADSLIIVQDVNDPLSLTKQKEVRKTLRVAEEIK